MCDDVGGTSKYVFVSQANTVKYVFCRTIVYRYNNEKVAEWIDSPYIVNSYKKEQSIELLGKLTVEQLLLS
jgi:hypothetical protein